MSRYKNLYASTLFGAGFYFPFLKTMNKGRRKNREFSYCRKSFRAAFARSSTLSPSVFMADSLRLPQASSILPLALLPIIFWLAKDGQYWPSGHKLA
ncbi:hypothetical protein [Syntrophomonas wolfei]|jgi:hypothetical protein|uniref:Uncharacterized protein n=1 Tax=Syntrophomonas wolfei TaxID=863 RepID=A0A354Z0U1_9FIRM|nr:hypothetical protein [Syntrophomonas wolfei]HBK54082.1 hypothetical protein [Syntrophomonas wolfei]